MGSFKHMNVSVLSLYDVASQCRVYSSILGEGIETMSFQAPTDLTVLDLLQGEVRPHSEDGLGVGGDGHTCVAAGLEDALRLSFAVQRVPLVHCTVHSTRHQPAVIQTPRDGPHLVEKQKQRAISRTHSLVYRVNHG